MANKGEILIYESQDHQTQVEVMFDEETVWLNQSQLAALFKGSRANIVEHIQNIYKEGELDEVSTCRNFRQVQLEGKREVKRNIEHYNLDVIISVGYRINSKQGTQFRQWATKRLKDYLVKGYAINQKRLDELGKMVELIEQSGKTESLHLQEAKGLLDILSHYTKSFVLLNQYDSHNLQTDKLNANVTYEIKYKEAKSAIAELKKQLVEKKEATELFGNKRIGAFLFVWFLEKNKHHFKKSGELKINDNALTAIALLVAQSAPEEKEVMAQLIINLIKD